MGAHGENGPALPFEELNCAFSPPQAGQVLDDVRFRKLGMFGIIHGDVFHDGVGYWRGYRPKFALSTYSRLIRGLDSFCPCEICYAAN